MKYILVISITLLIGVVILATNTPANRHLDIVIEQNPHLSAFIDSYESYVDDEFERVKLPGAAIVVIKDTTVLLMKGMGLRSINSKDSVNEQTVFRLASLSKGMSSILTAMLVMDRQLNWEDPVVKHLPEFQLRSKKQTQEVQIKHLLSHTTGLPYHAYTSSVESGATLEQILPKFRKPRLIGEPGEIYAYQNAVFSLIDPISEAVTGSSFDLVLKGYLFAPLNMEQASCSYEAITNNDNVALPHKRIGDTRYRLDKISRKYYNAIPAGGINASIEDMSKYIQVLLGNRPEVVSPEILDQVFTPIVDMKNTRRYRRWPEVLDAHYAMGWRVISRVQDTLINHSGYVNRYRSEIAFNPKDKVAICILSNAPTSFPDKCVSFFFDAYNTYRDSINTWEEQHKLEEFHKMITAR